jgi:transposase-like protein
MQIHEYKGDQLLKSNPSCPDCRSNKNIIRAGKREIKSQNVQLYLCKKCQKRFSKRTAKHSSYPPKIILSAISTYNLGRSLNETVKITNRRFKTHLPKSTVHSWVKRYKNITTFSYLRNQYIIDPEDIIQSKKFYHQQVYEFKYNKLKLNIAGKQFPSLRNYLLSLVKGLDNKPFKEGLRCSDFPGKLDLGTQRIKKISSNNATRIAGFGLELAKIKRERHQVIEDFFLINDSATVAVEVPVYLTPSEGRSIGLSIPKTLTGHIDILQMRKKRIHILDYKPDAEYDKSAQMQLTLYAFALSKRTKIPLKNMTCAYFNENGYFQFSPVL